MPNAAPISLTNGDDAVTLSPDSVTGTHVLYQDLDEGNLSARALLHYDRPASEKTTLRRSVRLALPLVRMVDGKEVIKTGTIRMEVVIPSDSTSIERSKLRRLGAQALLNSATAAIIDNPEWVW